MCVCVCFVFCGFSGDGVSLCCPGLSAVALSQLTATSTDSSNSCASVSQVAGITGMRCHSWLFLVDLGCNNLVILFVVLVEIEFHHVARAGVSIS